MSSDLPPGVSRKTAEYLRNRLAAEFNGEVITAESQDSCVIEVLVDERHVALMKQLAQASEAGALVEDAVWRDWLPRDEGGAVTLDVELQGRLELRLTLDVGANTPRDWAMNLGAASGLVLRFVDVGVSVREPPTLATLDVAVKPRQEAATLSNVDYWLRDHGHVG